VATVADKAKAALPAATGRIDAAVKIVLQGDVELLDDGRAKVASQSNGTTVYHVVNGECSCKDFPKAPQGMCKHRLAYGIHKRAKTLATAQLQALDAAPAPGASPPVALPEAPASVNVYVTLAGRQVQVTLRDADEQRLLARLEALLQRFPNVPPAAPELSEGFCAAHGVQMTQHHNAKGAWYSHKTATGWCKGTN
jgi:hypothetical protein